MGSDRKQLLKQYASIYTNSAKVIKDVDLVFQNYSSLSVRQERYVMDDGRSALLMYVYGTLPVNYRNQVYNIPILFWLPLHYPQSAPIVYVTPTPQMIIKPSQNVDPSGRFYHSFLEQSRWPPQKQAGKETLLELMRVMQYCFSLDPPVYSRPSLPSTPTSITSPPPTLQSSQLPSSISASSSGSVSGGGMQYSYPGVASSTSYYPNSTSFSRASNNSPSSLSMPVPELPERLYSPQSQQQQQSLRSSLPQSLSNAGSQQISNSLLKTLPSSLQHSSMPSTLSLPKPTSISNNTQASSDKEASEIHIKMDECHKQHQALLEHSKILSHAMSQYTTEISKTKDVIENLEKQKEALEKHLLEMEKFEMPPVDSLFTFSSPLYKQFLNEMAGDEALEDTLYRLGKEFQRQGAGGMDLQTYMRAIRTLSTRQFHKRALVSKIRSVIKN